MLRKVALLCSLAGCAAEPPRCSDDGLSLIADGVTTSCADRGLLCQNDACLPAWTYQAPLWPTCASDPHATPETLAAKAAFYDDVGARLHVHPKVDVALAVTLREGADEKTATAADVTRYHNGENDGLWSALFLASQAYRYAVTRSPEALALITRMVDGMATRMAVTGVPGVFTRTFIEPNVEGTMCPTDMEKYRVDLEKDDNRWVQIRDDGCIWFVGRESGAWEKSAKCGLDRFKGWCFLDNVSKDEYAGNIYALVLLMRLVDAASVQTAVRDMLGQVARHLMEHDLTLVDWDGRVTEHGHFSPLALDDYPAFNAAMALAYVKAGADATGAADLQAFYGECLLQRKGLRSCAGIETPDSFLSSFEAPGANGLYVGDEACRSNYNNISMHMLSLATLVWLGEDDPRVLRAVQNHLDVEAFRTPGQPRALINQHNALFDFVFAAHKRLGPGSDGHVPAVVEDGVCQLRQFRASQQSVDFTVDRAPYCKNRFDDDVSNRARESWERCPATFVWWGDPYSLRSCSAGNTEIPQPAGYLLPYWMARYYGFVDAQL